ncbi:ABC transporter permease [Hoeflea sp. YIM 152468]|uniref:ABC transporter permease n=1 Tax=Hoeflea sp. YIM 152468 TaxID=3031759 RepID=UPI0023DB5E4E|nr:ABC transporter permease [Hoeflea sp. YIM 152468]MDF1608655.1 ABC transporter permease [Hoeflea sp. YIM 152468]
MISTVKTGAPDKSIGQSDKKFRFDSLGLTLAFLALIVMFSLINPRFASYGNLLNVLTQTSTYVIVAMGMTLVITKGGIDLSVGSLMALVTCVAFGLIESGVHYVPALIIMFLLAMTLGALNGAIITFLAVPALIATLGTMVAFRGVALLHSAGKLYFGLPPEVVWLGQGAILGVPVPIYIAAIFILVTHWLFNLSRFGVHVRAVGGNREAARLAGIPVTRIEVAVYTYMGIAVALGGLIWMARIDGTQATLGTAMEIHIIAATIIGGTSLFGGRGSLYGTLIGALLLTMLNNALVIAGVEFFWQLVVVGVIVIAAVTINNIRENRIDWINQLRGRRAANRSKPG